jgi:hypothetical protein
VLAGVACAVLVGGLTGEVLTIALIAIGLGGAVLLVFLEVGLGEERDREREQSRRRSREDRLGGARRLPGRHFPRRRGPG